MPNISPSLDVRNLSVLSYAQGFTSWLYKGDFLFEGEALQQGVYTNFSHGDQLLVVGAQDTSSYRVNVRPNGQIWIKKQW